jgi:hypothetical protein
MQITLYHRSYPVAGAPASVSLAPFPAHQRHTFTAGGTVHEAVCKELRVVVPDGATIGANGQRLNWSNSNEPVLYWTGEKGVVNSTAKEVLDLARACGSGFRMA